MKRAYLDHAAATPVAPKFWKPCCLSLHERFGNPSAVYDLGAEIKDGHGGAAGQGGPTHRRSSR